MAASTSLPHTRFRFTAGILLAIALLALWTASLARAHILHALAGAWVVSQSITPADAVAVLGGGLTTRPFAAADLYKRGIAKQILISDGRLGPAENASQSNVELNRAVLLKLGIPAEAIGAFGMGVSSTYDEARALAEWTKATGAKNIIVPTELFSSRRVLWIFAKQLNTAGVQVQVLTLRPLEYDVTDWWQHEAGVIAFRRELIKYLYYRVKY